MKLISTITLSAFGVLLLAGCNASQTISDAWTSKPAVQFASNQEVSPDEPFVSELKRIALIATALVDGDDCREIVTDRSAILMFKVDPRDKWAGADNYDANPEMFIRVKKLLTRISLLVDFPTDCNLWMICKEKPSQVHMVIRQVNGSTLFYGFGKSAGDPTDDMREVLENGGMAVCTKENNNRASVLVPVRNSLDDIVGIVEVCARRPK